MVYGCLWMFCDVYGYDISMIHRVYKNQQTSGYPQPSLQVSSRERAAFSSCGHWTGRSKKWLKFCKELVK